MSILQYLLAIIAALITLIIMMCWPIKINRWPVFNRFSSRLKHPHKRALLLINESKKCLRHLHKQLKLSPKTPELAADIVHKMQRLLPIESVLSKEQARLYSIVQSIRESFFKARVYKHTTGKQRAAGIPAYRLNILIHIHSRLDKLNLQARELKTQTDTLLHLAEKYKTAGHYTKLSRCLKTAEKMQQQNIKLLKAIHNTEKDLVVISKKFCPPRRINIQG
jgi:hypothetical protein